MCKLAQQNGMPSGALYQQCEWLVMNGLCVGNGWDALFGYVCQTHKGKRVEKGKGASECAPGK
jgi:hypothetical protein